MDLSSKCNLYRQRQLRVLILNPCFWPMRHRPLPLASLPSPLSTFCADYVRFFTAIHEYGLQQHERARKISFTLYGWASLLYQDIRLSLSTVQMIILLQFQQNEVYFVRNKQLYLPTALLHRRRKILKVEGAKDTVACKVRAKFL